MKSGQGTVCDLSGHNPHYVPAHPRPTAPKTDPQEGKHLHITHLYLGFGLVLEIILCRGSVVFSSTLCCQVLEMEQSASLGQDPWPRANHPPTLQR